MISLDDIVNFLDDKNFVVIYRVVLLVLVLILLINSFASHFTSPYIGKALGSGKTNKLDDTGVANALTSGASQRLLATEFTNPGQGSNSISHPKYMTSLGIGPKESMSNVKKSLGNMIDSELQQSLY